MEQSLCDSPVKADQFVLRPVAERDIPGLRSLVASMEERITTLPDDEKFLQQKVHESLRSFYPHVAKPGGESYFFVLEDAASGRIVGTSALISRVGGFDPFYTYEVTWEQFSYDALRIDSHVGVLCLKKSHKGPSEIASLLLHPSVRRTGLGRLLALGRFLFMRAFQERFEEQVIAELRGYINAEGRSPFWESVARPFFKHDFYTADILSGLGDKEFIQALMPRHPIYIPLLPPEAQSVIGHVHTNTAPALHLLKREGFAETNEVDIFDAGPLVRAEVGNIRTIREARDAEVEVREDVPEGEQRYLLARPTLDFRSCLSSRVQVEGDRIALPKGVADLLGVESGATIAHVPA